MWDINSILNWLTLYGLGVVGAIIVLIVGRFVARKLTDFVGRLLEKNNIDSILTSFLKNFSYLALMTIVVITALNLVGFETTSIITILGAATLAIGFALQDSLSNLAAGVMLVFFKPYAVGDFVEINGARGFVKEVQVFNTIINTFENNAVIVANGAVLGSNITNFSAHGSMRLSMVFGISYDDDLLKAKRILEEILASQPEVLEDPAPQVSVLELGDSSVNFAVWPFVRTEDYWTVHFNTHEQVKLRFDAEGITIPFPTQKLNVVHEQS